VKEKKRKEITEHEKMIFAMLVGVLLAAGLFFMEVRGQLAFLGAAYVTMNMLKK